MGCPAEVVADSGVVGEQNRRFVGRGAVPDLDSSAGDLFGGMQDVEDPGGSPAADVVRPPVARDAGVKRAGERVGHVQDVHEVPDRGTRHR